MCALQTCDLRDALQTCDLRDPKAFHCSQKDYKSLTCCKSHLQTKSQKIVHPPIQSRGPFFFPVKLFPLENYYVPVLTAAHVHLKHLLLEWGEKQVHNLLKKRALLRPFSLQFLTRTVSGPMY